MRPAFKTFLQVTLLALGLFVFLSILIMPQSGVYSDALQRYDTYIQENPIATPEAEGFMKSGFIVGYLVFAATWELAGLFILSLGIAWGTLFFFKRRFKSKSNQFLLSDPYDSLKNILSNMFMFSFGIFNRRATEPLSYYFNLPVKSRIVGLLAYSMIFFSVTVIYHFPENNYILKNLIWLIYIFPIFPTMMIGLTFFMPAFRKNYQQKLFWFSINWLIVYWIMSGYLGYTLSLEQGFPENSEFMQTSFIQGRDILTNVLIVLAFSFYIELMKSVLIEKSSMEAEIRVARRIQNELIPEVEITNKSFELFGKTMPAKAIGGDYIDAVHLDDGKTVLTVADVSGHSVASGLLMSMLKTAFRTELKYFTDPAAMAASLNRTIFENKDKSMFISFLFGLIDWKAGKFLLVNGGHPPLLHFAGNNGTVSEYRTGDLALGLKENASFKVIEISYARGDIFVFFSDGLIESINSRGEEWGMKNMIEILKRDSHLPVRELYHSLIAGADDFRGSIEQRDDLTLMVLKMI